nr:myoD family inhibitor domain-containing protein isoform X2 [Ovis aries]
MMNSSEEVDTRHCTHCQDRQMPPLLSVLRGSTTRVWLPSCIRTSASQPQRLPQLQTAVQESEEEISKIKNGHPSLSNGNGIHHGAKHISAENRRLSAPVSQKMHRKIHSSLSVNSDISKKSKVNAVFSQKTGSSPEDCCVHCILACLFCEFLTLCNIVLGQASCGICTSEACCCCCGDEMGDDCNCPCDMDCGIMDACCESSDCLEICMECCGICFPS